MDITETLVAARGLIERPECWTKEKFARDANGVSVYPREAAAVCWCMEGAVRKVSRRFESSQKAIELLQKAAGLHPLDGIAAFNDAPGRTHAEVIDVFDRAIASARQTTV